MEGTDAFIAINRFGFGGDALKTATGNPKKWLSSQLNFIPQYKHFEDLLPTAKIATRADDILSQGGKNLRRVFLEITNNIYQDEIYARTQAAIITDSPFYERLVHFWSNHFAVSAITSEAKSYEMKSFVGAFEREAIRPNILGSFKDLLIAVEQHPAMLIYLDNILSIGPKSRAGKLRKRGLNENLAREILELHTLGVNGGYTQNDVKELAKIITGWVVDRSPDNKNKGFRFKSSTHEPDPKKLLGIIYKEEGLEEGIKVLENLSRHPSTAKFIARKMLTHFISDSPTENMIRHLADTFIDTDGDLQKVTLAMLDLPEAWEMEFNKIKTPTEYVVAAARSADGKNKKHRKFILDGLKFMGHYPFNVSSPAGYSDQTSDWTGSEAVMRRVEWANEAANTFEVVDSVSDKAASIFGSSLGSKTESMIKSAKSKKEALAFMFASPEFQMR